jgi:phage-related minor tail protein
MFSGLTSTIGSGLSSFGNMVMSGLGSIGGGLSSLGGMLMNGLSGLLGGISSMGGMAMSGLSGVGSWAMTGLSALAMFLATGGVFAHGAMIPFARGGAFTNSIVNRPTIFPMASGSIGLMGEAGPEAVMPLTRMSNGKLGVSIADFAPMPAGRAVDSRAAGNSMIVNIYNESGNEVERKEYTHSDGTRELMIRIKREVQDDIMRGGQIGRAIEATYGSQRSTVKR